MTDNKVYVFEDAKEAVLCSRSDGMAVYRIRALGIPQLILSTERNKVVQARAKKLKIGVIQSVHDKKAVLGDFCRRHKYALKKVVYIGNDTNDIDAMKLV